MKPCISCKYYKRWSVWEKVWKTWGFGNYTDILLQRCYNPILLKEFTVVDAVTGKREYDYSWCDVIRVRYKECPQWEGLDNA